MTCRLTAYPPRLVSTEVYEGDLSHASDDLDIGDKVIERAAELAALVREQAQIAYTTEFAKDLADLADDLEATVEAYVRPHRDQAKREVEQMEATR